MNRYVTQDFMFENETYDLFIVTSALHFFAGPGDMQNHWTNAGNSPGHDNCRRASSVSSIWMYASAAWCAAHRRQNPEKDQPRLQDC